MTPQTLDNDLEEGRLDPFLTVLVIFDEAHRATGNYAYTKIVKNLESYNFGFRILALSATPGNNFDQIQEVVNNLKIAKLEVKDDSDADIKRYIHMREVIPLVIKGTDLIDSFKTKLNKIMEYPWKILLRLNAVPENIKVIFYSGKGEMTQLIIFKLRQEINNRLEFYKEELGKGIYYFFYFFFG